MNVIWLFWSILSVYDVISYLILFIIFAWMASFISYSIVLVYPNIYHVLRIFHAWAEILPSNKKLSPVTFCNNLSRPLCPPDFLVCNTNHQDKPELKHLFGLLLSLINGRLGLSYACKKKKKKAWASLNLVEERSVVITLTRERGGPDLIGMKRRCKHRQEKRERRQSDTF